MRLIAAVALLVPVLATAKQETKINVIPYPQSVEIGKGQFKAAGANFNCESSIDSKSIEAIRKLAEELTYVSGRTSTVAVPAGFLKSIAEEGKMKGFVFLKDGSMGPEAYSIDVSGKSCIVRANGFNGFLYALQTIRQLTDVSVFGEKVDANQKFMIPCVKINDKPRFAYRGLHLDCSRHFWPVEEVKKYLDIMAVYKLNKFHWHLTDDQGWRIEIKKFPRLTEVGAFRNGTMVGADPNTNDGVRYGGYYTQDQIREIVAYAADRGIDIIPEIEVPGHSSAAIAAYPMLSCTAGPFEVPTTWGIFSHTLCPGKDAMFNFLNAVFTEVAELFPYEYVHIGGDECPRTDWEVCPDCQERIKELGLKGDDKHSAEDYLQNYVTARVQEILAEKGRKIIGWDEILEGNLAEGATVMSWRGTKGGIEASAKGFDVIMTPNTYCYFDYLQAQQGEPLGGGDLTLEKVYSYEPFDGLDAAQQKHILGVQANVWTEFMPTVEHMEYMLLPRLTALSEVQWCTPENKNLERYKYALENESIGIFKSMGFNYRKLDK